MRLTIAPLITGHREAGAIRAAQALAADPDPRVQAAGIAFFADQDGPIGKARGLAREGDRPGRARRGRRGDRLALEKPRPGTESA
jgi:hypothetical protein